VLDATDLADDPSLVGLAGRRADHDRLDDRIATWAATRSLDDALDALVAAGVPAARLADHRAIHLHPHLQSRGYFEDAPHVVVGSLPIAGMPFRMTGFDRWIEAPAPTMGEHNREVLGGLLGLDDVELDRLTAAGVIGDRPVGS
jgi:crotonobetainyl-CoA:carnitine CoA-transferase CaiB-like acyl-CoA transferase